MVCANSHVAGVSLGQNCTARRRRVVSLAKEQARLVAHESVVRAVDLVVERLAPRRHPMGHFPPGRGTWPPMVGLETDLVSFWNLFADTFDCPVFVARK